MLSFRKREEFLEEDRDETPWRAFVRQATSGFWGATCLAGCFALFYAVVRWGPVPRSATPLVERLASQGGWLGGYDPLGNNWIPLAMFTGCALVATVVDRFGYRLSYRTTALPSWRAEFRRLINRHLTTLRRDLASDEELVMAIEADSPRRCLGAGVGGLFAFGPMLLLGLGPSILLGTLGYPGAGIGRLSFILGAGAVTGWATMAWIARGLGSSIFGYLGWSGLAGTGLATIVAFFCWPAALLPLAAVTTAHLLVWAWLLNTKADGRALVVTSRGVRLYRLRDDFAAALQQRLTPARVTLGAGALDATWRFEDTTGRAFTTELLGVDRPALERALRRANADLEVTGEGGRLPVTHEARTLWPAMLAGHLAWAGVLGLGLSHSDLQPMRWQLKLNHATSEGFDLETLGRAHDTAIARYPDHLEQRLRRARLRMVRGDRTGAREDIAAAEALAADPWRFRYAYRHRQSEREIESAHELLKRADAIVAAGEAGWAPKGAGRADFARAMRHWHLGGRVQYYPHTSPTRPDEEADENADARVEPQDADAAVAAFEHALAAEPKAPGTRLLLALLLVSENDRIGRKTPWGEADLPRRLASLNRAREVLSPLLRHAVWGPVAALLSAANPINERALWNFFAAETHAGRDLTETVARFLRADPSPRLVHGGPLRVRDARRLLRRDAGREDLLAVYHGRVTNRRQQAQTATDFYEVVDWQAMLAMSVRERQEWIRARQLSPIPSG